MKEIIEIIKEITDINIEIEEIEEFDEFEELEELDEIEEVEELDETEENIFIPFEEKRKEYSLGNITVLKYLEKQNYSVLYSAKKYGYKIESSGVSSYIENATTPEEMRLRSEWAEFTPLNQELFINNIQPRLYLKEIPKSIRKWIKWNCLGLNNLWIIEELILSKCINPDKIPNIIENEELLNSLQDLDNIGDLSYYLYLVEGGIKRLTPNQISHYIEERYDEEEEEEEKTSWELKWENYPDDNTRNKKYCQMMDDKGYKIPYYDYWEHKKYIIKSPDNCMDFALQSEACDQCVGSPLQWYLWNIVEEKKEEYIFFFLEDNKRKGTFTVNKNKEIVDFLLTHNRRPNQEAKEVIKKYAKEKGYSYRE